MKRTEVRAPGRAAAEDEPGYKIRCPPRGFTQRHAQSQEILRVHIVHNYRQNMRELLDLDGMARRIAGFAGREESAGELPSGAALVLREIFLRGEIPRGDVARIAGVSPRTGQTITRELLKRRLILSDSAKRPIRLGFPADAASHYFPNLFPAGAE